MASTQGNANAISSAKVVCDRQACIPLTKVLTKDDVVLLLTPAVVQHKHGDQNKSQDPFEVFGKALETLAKSQPDEKAWTGNICHVGYTTHDGIGDYYKRFRGVHVVIFATTGRPTAGERDQADLAAKASIMFESRPQIILACCELQGGVMQARGFPTIVQISQYSPQELLAAAALFFREIPAAIPPTRAPIIAPPSAEVQRQHWRPKAWLTSDMPGTFELWTQCLPRKYDLPRHTLLSLLDRDGWSKHFVVRDPTNRERVLGFCATYMCYKARSQEDLIASLALLIVHPEYRNRGIGWSLHSHAVRHFKEYRGVKRVQLGSTVPRLLYGPPDDMANLNLGWFARRGWTLGRQLPGQGQQVCDWVLRFEDLPSQSFAPAGLTFRPCRLEEINKVLDIAESESMRQNIMGWFDQYAMLKPTPFVETNILVCLEGDLIVAAALVYTPEDGSPTARDFPWAGKVGRNTGGISCICIAENLPGMVNSRNAIMIRLLNACIRTLAERGMEKLYIDAVKGGDEGFQSIGFQKWATYRDIWIEVESLSQQWPFDSY